MSQIGARPPEPERTGDRRDVEPDVLLDIPNVSVDAIRLAVNELDADVSLRVRLANLLQLDAGVRVHLAGVELDIEGVQAEALLKVRLERLVEILDRALTTLDRNPEIIQALARSADVALTDVNRFANRVTEATAPVIGEAGREVGQPVTSIGAVADRAGTVVPDDLRAEASPGARRPPASPGHPQGVNTPRPARPEVPRAVRPERTVGPRPESPAGPAPVGSPPEPPLGPTAPSTPAPPGGTGATGGAAGAGPTGAAGAGGAGAERGGPEGTRPGAAAAGGAGVERGAAEGARPGARGGAEGARPGAEAGQEGGQRPSGAAEGGVGAGREGGERPQSVGERAQEAAAQASQLAGQAGETLRQAGRSVWEAIQGGMAQRRQRPDR
ncbi:hypothetical protein V6U81_08915 [Micromonospora sp. CPCC 205711]|uniref:hypothetical protein n=1 Tax=Micromonospora sp. CPCC 205547 TaxID=3122400 RepID=UPI002FF1D0D8